MTVTSNIATDVAGGDAEPVAPIGWAFTGDRLRAVRTREDPPSPIPGVLDPAPHLHVMNGQLVLYVDEGGEIEFRIPGHSYEAGSA